MKTIYVGQVFYSILYDDTIGTCECETWVVRTIRNDRVTAIRKDRFTWGKVSKTNGDFGWIDSAIGKYDRETWDINRPVPSTLSTTRAGAYRYAITQIETNVDTGPMMDKLLRTCRSMIARLT